MRKIRFSRIGFAVGCFFLLTAQSCWDFVLERRVCPVVTVEVEVNGGSATVPDCLGVDPLLTVRHRETYSVVGLDEEVVTVAEIPRQNPLASFEVTSAPCSLEQVGTDSDGEPIYVRHGPGPGVSTSFVLDFEPRGRGRWAEPFDQEIEVLVLLVDSAGVCSTAGTLPHEPPAGCAPGPVARDEVCETLEAAVSSWLQRCNPELTEAEVDRLAAERICGDPANPFEDEDIGYDELAAQVCGCEIVDMSCGAPDPFLALQSCMDTLTGLLEPGPKCTRDEECASGYCLLVDGCEGICETPKAAGDACIAPIFGVPMRCEPGYYCDTALDTPICVATALLGQPCAETPCAGADTYVFPTVQCVETLLTCEEVIKSGGPCDPPPCHDLYACDEDTQMCVELPGDNEPCTLSIDVAAPTHSQWVILIEEARQACRLDLDEYGIAGEYCIQDGATSGTGRCGPLPYLGEACGLGDGLSPRCQSGSYCDALASGALTLATGTCVAGLPENAVCDEIWEDLGLGSQCQAGYFCDGEHCQPQSCSAREEEL